MGFGKSCRWSRQIYLRGWKKKESENERKLFLGEFEKEILNDEYRNVSAISNHRIGWLDDRYSSNGVKLLNFYYFP